jgi:hypothetical protein
VHVQVSQVIFSWWFVVLGTEACHTFFAYIGFKLRPIALQKDVDPEIELLAAA